MARCLRLSLGQTWDQPDVQPFGPRAQECQIMDVWGVKGHHQKDAVVQALSCLME